MYTKGLQKLMDDNKYNIKELSIKLRTEPETVKRWINGLGEMRLEEIIMLSKILNSSTELLIHNEYKKKLDLSTLNNDQCKSVIITYNIIKNKKINNINLNSHFHTNKTLGEKLKFLRTLITDHTQVKLAKKLSVSQSTIRNWEHDYSKPTVDNIVQLAALYNVTTDYLIFENHGFELSSLDLSNKQHELIISIISYFREENYEKLIEE